MQIFVLQIKNSQHLVPHKNNLYLFSTCIYINSYFQQINREIFGQNSPCPGINIWMDYKLCTFSADFPRNPQEFTIRV